MKLLSMLALFKRCNSAILQALCLGCLVSSPAFAFDSFVYLNEAHMAAVKAKIDQGDTFFKEALDELVIDATNELLVTANPVTNKSTTPPSGNKHDYMSIAPYWWPNPDTANGLPWIRKDGHVNPMTRGDDTDQLRTSKFFDAVELLSLAYYFTGDTSFSDKAKSLIQIWLLDSATKMNPNINFGQAVPGVNEGRPAGVIEWEGISAIVMAMQILERDGLVTDTYKANVKAWLDSYYTWLTTNQIGVDEGNTTNNHANWYDYQAIGIAMYLDKIDAAKAHAARHKTRIGEQIEPDGSMPEELGRTKSINYCSMNTIAFNEVSVMAKKVGVDTWNYTTADGRSLQKALAFLKPYVLKEKTWTWEQITTGGADAALESTMKPMFSRVSTMQGSSLLPASANAYLSLSAAGRLKYPPREKLIVTSSSSSKSSVPVSSSSKSSAPVSSSSKSSVPASSSSSIPVSSSSKSSVPASSSSKSSAPSSSSKSSSSSSAANGCGTTINVAWDTHTELTVSNSTCIRFDRDLTGKTLQAWDSDTNTSCDYRGTLTSVNGTGSLVIDANYATTAALKGTTFKFSGGTCAYIKVRTY